MCNGVKASCAPSEKSQTLTVGICSEVDLLQGVKQGSGRQASGPFNLVFELQDFFEGRGINHHLVTFLNSLGSWDMSLVYNSLATWSMAQGSVSLPSSGENNLSLYLNNDIYNSKFTILMRLSTTPILVTWLWLISVQLASDWDQRR